MNNFDFLVIGAMKSGTTTIHDILKKDSRIALPRGKETPFFTDKEKLDLGLECFFKRYYSGNLDNKCVGKVSPQYMAWHEIASVNIAKYSPNSKLIAVLRDPIDRLLSHYSMCVGMGIEKRTLNQAIEDCLNLDIASKTEITRTNSYIHWSCYGRILSQYSSALPSLSSNLLILSFDELVHHQSLLVTKVYQHIGLSLPSGDYENIRSLSRGKHTPFFSKLLVHFPWLAKGIVKALPHKYKDVVRMLRIETQISMYAPKVLRNEISQKNMASLQEIFDKDKENLKELEFNPYWRVK